MTSDSSGQTKTPRDRFIKLVSNFNKTKKNLDIVGEQLLQLSKDGSELLFDLEAQDLLYDSSSTTKTKEDGE